MPLWRAAQLYEAEGESTVIVAGERYGTGSSRDWAAKGPALLGVRAVLAASFERIHRSNLVNMGVLPLRLPEAPDALGITAGDRIEVDASSVSLAARAATPVTVLHADGRATRLEARAEVETSFEVATLRAGGLLPLILQQKLAA
jgi:aconitate hydratase